jgi:neutral ceramidase
MERVRSLIRLGFCLGAIACFQTGSVQAAASFRAGLGRVKITPQTPIWMSGYAARSRASEGVMQGLWAKALALVDDKGNKVVLVSVNLIGLPRAISDEVAARVESKHGLARSQLVLNASHTHCGPAVRQNLAVMYDLDAENRSRVETYGAALTDSLVQVIGAALDALAPAELAVGHGSAGFAVNRREPTAQGFRIGVNPGGPVDHDVPVLKVSAPDGSLRVVLFAYACHNTTLGADIYQINGDYAGRAQAELEQTHPGAMAMFVMLCGGDQNPNPRGTLHLVNQHGRALASEVSRVLGTPLQPVRPPIRTAVEVVQLDFAAHSRAVFEEESQQSNPYRQRRARLMLAAYDDGEPVRQTPYPVQAVRFNRDLTLLALGGEVVVDYAARSKREFPQETLIVAGYCHDVMCYIPSRRVLREGGYEAADSMIYYGQPGSFAESVEETISAAVHRVMKRVGAKGKPAPAAP